MVAPRVRARLDRQEPVLAVGAGPALADAQEVGIERRRERGLAPVHVAATCVGLPDLDERVGHRRAVLVEHPAGDDAALTDRLAAGAGVGGEVGIVDAEVASTPAPGRWSRSGSARSRSGRASAHASPSTCSRSTGTAGGPRGRAVRSVWLMAAEPFERSGTRGWPPARRRRSPRAAAPAPVRHR